MDTVLSVQIQATLDALAFAQTEAERVTQTMRMQGIYYGLSLSHVDQEVAQLIAKLRYLKVLAERREQARSQLDGV
jgi:hypothetical protein